jgi:hypothetical protein
MVDRGAALARLKVSGKNGLWLFILPFNPKSQI